MIKFSDYNRNNIILIWCENIFVVEISGKRVRDNLFLVLCFVLNNVVYENFICELIYKFILYKYLFGWFI